MFHKVAVSLCQMLNASVVYTAFHRRSNYFSHGERAKCLPEGT